MKLLARKQSFTWNSHSRSLQFIHFAISLRPTRGSMSSYNTAGLISKVSEEVATQIDHKLPSSTTLSFETPAKSNPRDYPHILYISRKHTHWPTFSSLLVWDCLQSFCAVASKKASCLQHRRFGRSRLTKVDDFGTNRKCVRDFLFVSIVTMIT